MFNISIIIPVYNVATYLAGCLESVLAQTYTNLEVILVNDGSLDNSLEICQAYANRDERFRVYTKENGGLSSARNYGLDKATGDYVFFLDSDDYLASSCIADLYELLNHCDVGVSVGAFAYDYDGQIQHTVTVPYFEEILTSEQAVDSIYNHERALPVSFTTAWGKLYKRELFDNLRFPEGKLHEDEFTTYKTYLKAGKVVYCHKELYYYRQRTGSIMAQDYNLTRLDVIEALEERLAVLNDQNLPLLTTQKALLGSLAYHRYRLKKLGYQQEYQQINENYKKVFVQLLPQLSLTEKVKAMVLRYAYNIKIMVDTIRGGGKS